MWLCGGVAGVSSTLLAAVVTPEVHWRNGVVVPLFVAAVFDCNVGGGGDANWRWLWYQILSCAVLASVASRVYYTWL